MFNAISTDPSYIICSGVTAGLFTNGTSSQVVGIHSVSGVNTLDSNSIYDLSSDVVKSDDGAASGIIGILQQSTEGGQTISRNKIHTLKASNTLHPVSVAGIYYSGGTSGTNVVERNLIYGLSTEADDAVQSGIYSGNGSAEYKNNLIRLGIRANGNDINSKSSMNGILDGSTLTSSNMKFYHNSVYIGGAGVVSGSEKTYGFRSLLINGSGNNTIDIRNNIFMNDRSNTSGAAKHYGIALDRVGGVTSDNNIIYGSGTGFTFGLLNTADQADLDAWKAATGKDDNSIFDDPYFIDATAGTPNLHIDTLHNPPSPADGAAAVLPSVTIDYDSEIRSNTFPDIGADEFCPRVYTLTPPKDTLVCKTGSAYFAISSNSTNQATYQWQVKTSPSASWTNLTNGTPYSGVNSDTLKINGALITQDGYYFRCVFSNPCISYTSDSALFSVDTTSLVAEIPVLGNQGKICSGFDISSLASVSGGSGTPTYSWQYELPAGTGNWQEVSTDLEYNSPPLFNTNPDADSTRVYKFVYSRSGSGCGSVESNQRNLTIYAPPTIVPVRDQCASTFGSDKWDYIYINSGANGNNPHSITNVEDVTNTYAGDEVFSSGDNKFKIFRVPMHGGYQEFTVTDNHGCQVTSTTDSVTNTALPTGLPRVNGAGFDTSTCYLRQLDDWAHFRPAGNSTEVIASVKDNGIDLGKVTVHSYKANTAVAINPPNSNCPSDMQAAMRRHFVIQSDSFPAPKQLPGNVTVRLYFDQSDFDDLSTASTNNNSGLCTGNDDITHVENLYVTKYTGSNENGNFSDNNFSSGVFKVFHSGSPVFGQDLTISDNGFNNTFGTSGNNYFAQLEITEFSEFWLHGGIDGSALPVTMLFIEAKNINNEYIKVLWATAAEINNNKFEVERSEDGIHFTKIGEVLGNGTTTERKDYFYNDKTAVVGIRYYYRLKQIDFDETFEYSPIVSEMLKGEDLFTVSEFVPNPATDQAKLFIKTGKEQEITIEVHNYIGQVVKEGKTYLNKGSNTISVDFNDLAAGTYTTRIIAGKTVIVRRVVITR